MITVSGQLIDQLRAMKDLVSSLIANASNLVTSYLKGLLSPLTLFRFPTGAIVVDPSSTLSAEPSGLDQFNQKGRGSIFFTQLFVKGSHTFQ